MKTVGDLFTDVWRKKDERGWDCVYIMVDLHNVILPSNYHKGNDLQFISPFAEKCLQYLSKKDDVRLILWTSSYPDEVDNVLEWLEKADINFSYVNINPLEKSTEYADFSEKPYFNILLDDKAGFEGNDWKEIWQWIQNRKFDKLK